MSDNQYDDLLNDDTEVTEVPQDNAQTPKALREYAKEQKKAREAAEAELVKLRNELRQGEVKSKLAAAGLPEGAAKFAAGAEDIDAWINENRGLFGVAGTAEPAEDLRAPVGDAAISPEDQSAMQLVQGVQPGAFNPGTRGKFVQDIESASTEAELNQLLQAQGLLKGGRAS